eukprot:CAMPEP_0182442744 /NCGR_PEP_ID=MMETSP1172-20130603/1639_1 /TAXON_ID=708627 /ORGANISM="Timspurckia oligopyrenoides, Strain CCMP3278" /LENGTH=144 /DNA_ID=CAMNT_0024637763 /DNA_START=31 /DNA_END=465 /DNA_ORIENTATION=-
MELTIEESTSKSKLSLNGNPSDRKDNKSFTDMHALELFALPPSTPSDLHIETPISTSHSESTTAGSCDSSVNMKPGESNDTSAWTKPDSRYLVEEFRKRQNLTNPRNDLAMRPSPVPTQNGESWKQVKASKPKAKPLTPILESE